MISVVGQTLSSALAPSNYQSFNPRPREGGDLARMAKDMELLCTVTADYIGGGADTKKAGFPLPQAVWNPA